MSETVIVCNIERGVQASVVLRGDVTQRGIDKLIEILALERDTFPDVTALTPPADGASDA